VVGGSSGRVDPPEKYATGKLLLWAALVTKLSKTGDARLDPIAVCADHHVDQWLRREARNSGAADVFDRVDA
jgi:hypothetical protein